MLFIRRGNVIHLYIFFRVSLNERCRVCSRFNIVIMLLLIRLLGILHIKFIKVKEAGDFIYHI